MCSNYHQGISSRQRDKIKLRSVHTSSPGLDIFFLLLFQDIQTDIDTLHMIGHILSEGNITAYSSHLSYRKCGFMSQ
jgi:hypothetical protein